MGERFCVKEGEQILVSNMYFGRLWFIYIIHILLWCTISGILFVYPSTDVVSFHFVRLNFDYDIRRGSEEGPWIDGSECFFMFLLII